MLEFKHPHAKMYPVMLFIVAPDALTVHAGNKTLVVNICLNVDNAVSVLAPAIRRNKSMHFY